MQKDPTGVDCPHFECKYLSDYLALKLSPKKLGDYTINFFNRATTKPIASSPYQIAIHEDFKEIIKSSGIYDVTRLTIAENYLLSDYEIGQFKVIVYGLTLNS